MKKLLLFSIVISVFGVSCKKDLPVADENLLIYKALDGNYNIVKATATSEEDVNMDGIYSSDMLKEIPNLINSDFDIIITKSSKLYRLHWAEQVSTLTNEVSGPVYFYIFNATFNNFEFSKNQFHLNANDNISDINKETHVEIQDDTIKVTLKRTLKTSIGSRVITINADYKKNNDYSRPYNNY